MERIIMETPNIEKLKTFTMDDIPELDTVVMGALELLQQKPIPKINLSAYKHPIVVGSGGAEATSRIIFEKTDAIFASESDFEEKVNNITSFDSVVIVSASGSKHAPIVAEVAKSLEKRVMLITTTPNSPANQVMSGVADFDEYIFPKNREPYTYNASTYMGMVLGMTGEDPAKIMQFINDCTSKLDFPDFSKYDKYYIMVPTEFLGICKLIHYKFTELFGRQIARDVETFEFTKRHAAVVVPSDELFISFGEQDKNWGEPENRLFVPLPEDAGYGAMMAVAYYTVGQIQKAYPYYFKENIGKFIQKVNQMNGSTLSPIVEV